MKITKEQLSKIIKEEISSIIIEKGSWPGPKLPASKAPRVPHPAYKITGRKEDEFYDDTDQAQTQLAKDLRRKDIKGRKRALGEQEKERTRRPRSPKDTEKMRRAQDDAYLKRIGKGHMASDARGVTSLTKKQLRDLNKGKFEEADQNLDSDGDVIDLDYLGDIYSDIYKELYKRRPRHEMFKTEEEAQEAIDKLLDMLRSRREDEDYLTQMDAERQAEEDEIQSLMPDPLDQEDLPMQTGFGRRMEAVDKIYNIIKEKINSEQNFYEVDAEDVNEEYCPVCRESQELEEKKKKKKKKACKPAKGKRFAKRVKGKCRSFGQAGKAKDGGDRIRPGTAKADAYCARSAKIKKCKNPPCANTLSRRKWKCQGSKSVP